MDKHKVVVTGLGAVTALGHTIDETFSNLCQGVNGIQIIDKLKNAGFPVFMGACVKNQQALLDKYEDARKYSSRKLAYICKSLDDAMKDSGLKNFENIKTGIFLGMETSRIDIKKSYEIYKKAGTSGSVDSKLFFELCRNLVTQNEVQNKFPSFPARYIASKYSVSGPMLSTSNACASSNYALGAALQKLRSGRIDMAVAGSADEMIDEYIITGFSLLRALSDDNENFSTTSRPFDIRRRGFVLGEGGAVLILETLEHAQKRNARVICEFAGYGTSSDGHKITACHKEGLHLKRAMERALQSAGIIADDIDYVNAHGTSTRLNDQAEARALLSLFGAKAGEIAVNSSKSMLGHTVAAAGAIEAAITCMSIKTGMFHPTRNYEKSDPGLDLDFCPLKSGKKDIRAALSNSSGFSGGNSSLCFKKI